MKKSDKLDAIGLGIIFLLIMQFGYVIGAQYPNGLPSIELLSSVITSGGTLLLVLCAYIGVYAYKKQIHFDQSFKKSEELYEFIYGFNFDEYVKKLELLSRLKAGYFHYMDMPYSEISNNRHYIKINYTNLQSCIDDLNNMIVEFRFIHLVGSYFFNSRKKFHELCEGFNEESELLHSRLMDLKEIIDITKGFEEIGNDENHQAFKEYVYIEIDKKHTQKLSLLNGRNIAKNIIAHTKKQKEKWNHIKKDLQIWLAGGR